MALLYKYISGYTTDDEKKQVVEWLYADKANMEKYTELRKIYDASVWVEQLDDINQIPAHKKRIVLHLFKIAVVIVLILMSTYLGYKQYYDKVTENNQMLTMIIPVGQYGQLVLPDGSHVWLNSQSRLEFPFRFEVGTREVFLDGEAFFDVIADKRNPFVVHTKNYSVRALGTKFNICSFDKNINSKISLLAGVVDIELNNSKEKFALLPNQQLEFVNGEVSLTPISSLSYFEWKNGYLSFENESIKDLLDKLSHCYAIEFKIKNESILTDKYTGKFKIKDGVEQALKVLQLRSSFSYKKNGDYIIIEKK